MSDSDLDNLPEWNPSATRKRSSLPGGGADLARRLMDDMDPEVLEFLKSTVNSFIKWDLVIFFSENPNTTDTAVNIARYIGRDAAVIGNELDDLVASKMLQSDRSSGLTVYSLTTDPHMRERFKRFVSVVGDVQFRGKVFYHLIR